MPDIDLGSHTIQSHGFKVAKVHKHDWLILLLLVVIEAILLIIEPFHRFVGEDMMSDMKYPLKGNTVPFWAVPMIAIVFPFVIFLVFYFTRKDVYDFHHAILGLLFAVLLTAVITDAIKDAVGRPRPDFFWRCFPNGKGDFDPLTKDVICHGDKAVIKEGYKSFPSGHSSWSFAGLSFLSWYLAGKIRAFDRRGHVAKLCIILFPFLLAALVAISRVDDYWHHWQDVFTGALIGSIIASFCYLQFFPYPNDTNGWAPHSFFQMMEERNRGHSSAQRVNSFHLQNSEIGASFMGRNSGMESTESSSHEHDTTPVLDAMETGRKY
ncbi:lipid phosphate phosphatase 2 isoform X2 [Eucalyptus grandis]|nr:lipid phosphate phosphatase 2 isoform X2 [Eucalyptus grandis]XP_039161339.1 lipid phosphate phosphatase 2 isoform X2 [Eucalyptus grandis]